jgi:hypothetical protein
MANSKISALTSATTPLAGTETLPVVQSGATTQVSVANLTAGRAVSAASLALTTSPLPATSGGTGASSAFVNTGIAYASSTTTLNTSTNLIWNGTSFKVTSAGRAISTTGTSVLFASNSATHTVFIGDNNFAYFQLVTLSSPTYLSLQYNSAELMRFDSGGNLIPKVANTGVNFTSNTPAAGMTSQLLNWYEEGTWTPAQGGGLTVVGAFSSTGKYTRIGREVRVSGTVTGATSVAVTAAGVITTNLPFTVGTAGHGNVTNAALTSFAAIICTSTNITSAGAIAATGTLTFSATYFV